MTKPNQDADRATLTGILELLLRIATAVESSPLVHDSGQITGGDVLAREVTGVRGRRGRGRGVEAGVLV